MGLTVHYDISAPNKWSWDQTVAKLRAAQAFAASLPIEEVTPELMTFEGPDADFDKNTDENVRWFLIQSQRYISSPWHPGSSFCQSPSKVSGFETLIAPGCEPMNIGIAEYPEYVCEPSSLEYRDSQKNGYPSLPYWQTLFRGEVRSSNEKASLKILRKFMRKWGLKKSPKNRRWSNSEQNYPHIINYLHTICPRDKNGYEDYERLPLITVAEVCRGHAENVVIIRFDDPWRNHGITLGAFIMEFKGSVDEAKAKVESHEFQHDLLDMVRGKETVIPATRHWHSFTKTQYASNPKFGGTPNFIKAHLVVISMLDKLSELGFDVKVNDESSYYKHRDIKKLAEEVGEWNSMIAGFVGVMNDGFNGTKYNVESPITDYQNFEHLEANAYNKYSKVRKVLIQMDKAAKKIIAEHK